MVCKSGISRSPSGIAALALVFVLGVTALLVVVGAVFTLTRQLSQEQSATRGNEALAVAESGAEEVALRIRRAETVPSPLTLVVGNGTATITNTTVGTDTTIISTGDVNGVKRAVELIVRENTNDVQFFYGVQVGDGGLVMDENSSVVGSVFSNGDITGDAGATITSDAIAAEGTLTVDANWTTQNADFAFGTTTSGVVSTTVDSGGDVGQYGSHVLGSDGFARIAYYDDAPNRDLKFARCLDADCATKNITTIDSAGTVGYRYTSIALGSDSFARISYLDDTNDDLKFIRCTNADCTTRTTTVVDTDDGQYSSMVLGSDGFARIAYYDGDLNFARCLDADCVTKNITEPDSTGDTGQYTSIALGSDGFARISYMYTTANDLKFARCTNADCTTSSVTTVDAGGNIHRNTSLVLGSDGFARISYMDDGNDDLKYARCTNADCTAANVTMVDGAEGSYSSIALASDGFPRISYYNGSDLAFVRCTNDDCTLKVVSATDLTGNTGQYTHLTIAADGFGRINYYDSSNKDLRFARCIATDCAAGVVRADAAQSFKLSTSHPVGQISMYLRKVGTPPDMTIRVTVNEGGRPGNSASDVVASGTLSASAVTGNYAWVDVPMTSSTAILAAGTTYWILADAGTDANNYWVWGEDTANGYTDGIGRYSTDWTGGNWTDAGGDLDFRVWKWVGGSMIQDMIIGNATTGSGRSVVFINDTIHGSACPNSYCIIEAPVRVELPISQAIIDDWKNDAAAGGTITGDCNPGVNCSTTLGPVYIMGNLNLTANNITLTVTGTVWVSGNIDISNGSRILLDSGYGSLSGVVLSDGWIHISNNGEFQGSGTAGSFVMLLSTLACTGNPGTGCGHHNGAIDLHNSAEGAIFYASQGMINLHNTVAVEELTGYKVQLDNNAVVTYNFGLANAQFSSGPGGGYTTLSWREIVPP